MLRGILGFLGAFALIAALVWTSQKYLTEAAAKAAKEGKKGVSSVLIFVQFSIFLFGSCVLLFLGVALLFSFMR